MNELEETPLAGDPEIAAEANIVLGYRQGNQAKEITVTITEETSGPCSPWTRKDAEKLRRIQWKNIEITALLH